MSGAILARNRITKTFENLAVTLNFFIYYPDYNFFRHFRQLRAFLEKEIRPNIEFFDVEAFKKELDDFRKKEILMNDAVETFYLGAKNILTDRNYIDTVLKRISEDSTASEIAIRDLHTFENLRLLSFAVEQRIHQFSEENILWIGITYRRLCEGTISDAHMEVAWHMANFLIGEI